jgi:hypothetical protein
MRVNQWWTTRFEGTAFWQLLPAEHGAAVEAQ